MTGNKSYIDTGFETTQGALQECDLLCRYMPANRFVQIIENSALWYSRINNWRVIDRLEAVTLPSIVQELGRPLGCEVSGRFLAARTELYLRSAFACCFMKYSGKNSPYMWNTFCPNDDGVMITIGAKEVAETASKQEQYKKFFREVDYISETQRKSLQVQDIPHATKAGMERYLNPMMSVFVKDNNFAKEREVRSLLLPSLFDK